VAPEPRDDDLVRRLRLGSDRVRRDDDRGQRRRGLRVRRRVVVVVVGEDGHGHVGLAPRRVARGLTRRLELGLDEGVVARAAGHEVVVRALFDDGAAGEDANLVGAPDRRQAVRDDERRPPLRLQDLV